MDKKPEEYRCGECYSCRHSDISVPMPCERQMQHRVEVAEKELSETKQALSNLVDALEDPEFTTDPVHCLIEACRVLGRKPKHVGD